MTDFYCNNDNLNIREGNEVLIDYYSVVLCNNYKWCIREQEILIADWYLTI